MRSIEALANSPWIVVISVLLALVSLGLSILFYIKGRLFKKLVYRVVLTELMSPSKPIPDLKILFQGREVTTLNITEIQFRNIGTRPIHREDISSLQPLTIKGEPANEILYTEFCHVKEAANNLDSYLKKDENLVTISFEYIGEKEDFTVRLYHAGAKSLSFKVSGVVKGGGKVKEGKKDMELFRLFLLVPYCAFLCFLFVYFLVLAIRVDYLDLRLFAIFLTIAVIFMGFEAIISYRSRSR